jgi:hypothetical protein
MIHRLLAVVFTVAIAASQAQAGTLIENFSGSFGPTTTLGGVALGTDTPLVGVTDGLVFNGLGSVTPMVSLTGVPEPSSGVLGGLAALGGLGVWARRRLAKVSVGAKTAELGGR